MNTFGIIDFYITRAIHNVSLILVHRDKEWENSALFGSSVCTTAQPATVNLLKIVPCLHGEGCSSLIVF